VVKQTSQLILVLLGWICLLLATIGVFLPILPTTPFVLLAAYFFSKGSVRIHNWLLSNKLFGPIVRDWESSGVIRTKAKILSTSMIIPLFSWTLIMVKVHFAIKIIVALTGVFVLVFIWTRPSEKGLNKVGATSEEPIAPEL
jgi:uncharacterized membrane protein YbaN (DUF454 family)